MHTKYLILFAFTLLTINLFGQPDKNKREEMREKIHAEKIAFIATEINLTADEAQRFWPIYNAYEEEIHNLRMERRKYHRELKSLDGNSGDQGYNIFEAIFSTEKKESDVRQKYLKLFADELGKTKAAKVFIAEENFKRELMKKFKNDRGHHPPPGE